MKLFLLCLFLGITLAGTAQVTKLNLASDIWPPFTNIEPHRSLATDLVNEALGRVGITANTEVLEFEEVIQDIRQGKYDGSAALWYSQDREEFLLYSAPYLQNQLIVVGRKGADVSMTSFSDLNGKRVAVVGNYAYGTEVDDARDVVLVSGHNDQENLERLIKEEVDYMLVDGLLIQYLITHQKDEVTKFLQVGTKHLFKRSLHFAIRKDLPGAESIIERFNQGIIKMVTDGSYNRILQLNWIRADVDGDGKLEMVASGARAGKSAPTSSYDVWFQNAASPPSNNRYYIEGQIYQGWDNVPQEYKVQPVSETQEDFKLMKFGF
jgi:ABC-type amino acid transport substrate-binding protein